mmetsp:Transcript_84191/g.219109  ORF Transcript_84191/g.219109 Transcript_84191/m.219109 type:complete len:272 (+) Transcript_84191:983-1798(+)
MQTPPQEVMPGPQSFEHPAPTAMHTPSQHSSPGPHRISVPFVPLQHELPSTAGRHSPPQAIRPSAHSSVSAAQPYPCGTQVPLQHCQSNSHMMPFPDGPSQQRSSSLATKHSPPQETIPKLQFFEHPLCFSEQTPSQQRSPAAHITPPLPVGLAQHTSSVVPTTHSPPQLIKPGPHCFAHPVPAAMHAPSQHSLPLAHTTAAPSGDSQQMPSDAPGKHKPPQATVSSLQTKSDPFCSSVLVFSAAVVWIAASSGNALNLGFSSLRSSCDFS